jgi:hypothetical protein
LTQNGVFKYYEASDQLLHHLRLPRNKKPQAIAEHIEMTTQDTESGDV